MNGKVSPNLVWGEWGSDRKKERKCGECQTRY